MGPKVFATILAIAKLVDFAHDLERPMIVAFHSINLNSKVS
jgi:hypothetical protein